jgi:hypothetical protein
MMPAALAAVPGREGTGPGLSARLPTSCLAFREMPPLLRDEHGDERRNSTKPGKPAQAILRACGPPHFVARATLLSSPFEKV